jgi:chaperone required for assembly of F1-ATPase
LRRFWDRAWVEEKEDGWGVTLDGKRLHLPSGAVLHVPGRVLAEAIAGEWQAAGGAKGGEMSYADVPLTRLAGTAQERITPAPGPTIEALAAYGESDLLCYRATHPPALAQRQMRDWQPWLDWAARVLDAKLRVTAGVTHVAQDRQTLAALRAAVAAQDAAGLAMLGIVVPALGSLVLGLALAERALDAETAHELATLDERFQQEFWGADREALERCTRVGKDVAEAVLFHRLAREVP